MVNVNPKVTLPLALAGAQIGTVEIDLEVRNEHAGQFFDIRMPSSANQEIAQGLVDAAERLMPGITSPQRYTLGLDQPAPTPRLEWPTTPGSAVLADKGSGLGPQVMILQQTPLSVLGWWAASDSLDAPPGAQRGWAWDSVSTIAERYTLLQILHVAP